MGTWKNNKNNCNEYLIDGIDVDILRRDVLQNKSSPTPFHTILKNGFSFSEDAVKGFYTKVGDIMQTAVREYSMADNPEFSDDERRLIVRLQKYRDRPYAWIRINPPHLDLQ